MKAKENFECKFLIITEVALRLRRRSGTLRRAGGPSERDVNFAKNSTPYKPVYILRMKDSNSIQIVLSLPYSNINNGYNYTNQNLTGQFPAFTPQSIMRNKDPFSLREYTKQQTRSVINTLKSRERR